MAEQPMPDKQRLTIDIMQHQGRFQLAAQLSLPMRGVTALFGSSGCGKTSLLRLVAGLDRLQKGRIALGQTVLADTEQGRCLPPHRRRLGVVFQEPRLFPHYRVAGNLRYGMPKHMARRFGAIVELLGIRQLLGRYPATLSGGEARRVAIGRALLSDPALLLMDEPLSGLDAARKTELLRYIRRLSVEVGVPIVFVSHAPEEIVDVADALVLMDAGKVLASGSLDEMLLRFDLSEPLAGFDGASRLVGQVHRHDDNDRLTEIVLADGQLLRVPAFDAPQGQSIRLRIPARDIALATQPAVSGVLNGLSYRNQLNAVIEEATLLSDSDASVELRLRLGDQALRARVTRQAWRELGLTVGQSVTALVRCVAFSAQHAFAAQYSQAPIE
ncbi:molybdenum ABC transporter ATP-binding protein [Halomonas halocynthiae]|uniref:molybdenum ABC transporter ATP-binding protein n=1 Tax=Halomonas halocynthiae TaxID=176290 RepID=UPI0006888BAE|nr:molybdenum ABC transporter ATP-binding protein [Halomonas halocynthiae]